MSRCGELGVPCGNRISVTSLLFVILPTLDDTSAPRVHPVHPVADRAIAAAVRGGSTGTHVLAKPDLALPAEQEREVDHASLPLPNSPAPRKLSPPRPRVTLRARPFTGAHRSRGPNVATRGVPRARGVRFRTRPSTRSRRALRGPRSPSRLLRQSGVTLLCRGVVSLVYRVETE